MRILIREHLIDVKQDGSFRLNMEYFNYCTGFTMTNPRFDALFGGSTTRAGGLYEPSITKMSAASVQTVLEDVVLRMARALREDTGARKLVPGRRRGLELRSQWTTAAREGIRKHLDSARGWRRRLCGGSGPGWRITDIWASLRGRTWTQ